MDIEKIEVRGLTRGEIKQLRKEGIVLGKLMELDEEKRDEAMDRLLGMACKDLDVDAITQGDAIDLYTRISELTYLCGDARKNSESPQSSALEESSTIAASADEKGSISTDDVQG
ncbi:MAG: hypothetical protein JW882_09830 [Deltaproteobacteria bacterium]|nr:hypothetical protein [Deltaproteobacteria bacterium]